VRAPRILVEVNDGDIWMIEPSAAPGSREHASTTARPAQTFQSNIDYMAESLRALSCLRDDPVQYLLSDELMRANEGTRLLF